MRLPPHTGRYVVIALSLVSAGFFAAYLRFLPYLAQEATYTDGRRAIELAEVERLRFAVWDEPLSLPETVNTPSVEGRAALSPDGRLLVFAVGEQGLNADLWVAPMVDGEPLDPRPLPAVNTPFEELSPAFSERWLYFASNRPGGAGRLDLYRVEYEDGVFGAVEWLGRDVNTAADESGPAPTPGSTALAFSSDRPRGRRTDHDLYLALADDGKAAPSFTGLAEGAFLAINTPFDERDPAFAVDGLALLFASDRDGSLGGLDLWRSVRSAGAWLEPEPLVGLNTEWTERAPMPSPDGFSLLFSAETPGDGGDLFRARSVELFRLPGRPVGWLDLTILALLLLVALLAWLGRRWEALDILYKCLLVSLVVHLGLMFWFREVEMETEVVDLPEGSPTFTVRLAPTRADVARSRERAGRLELAQREAEAASSPSRHESTETPAETAAPSAAEALPTPRLADADAPSRSAADHARERSDAAPEVALQDRAETTPVHAADAPALAAAGRRPRRR